MSIGTLICLIGLSAQYLKASDTLYRRNIIGLEAGYHKGFIFAHSKDVQNTDGSYPSGFELSFYRQQRSSQIWDLCRCYPKSGFSIQYFDYDNTILGKSVNLNTFLEPYFNTGNKIQLSVRGLAGFSYLTNPYHPVHNPTNMSYSMTISGYVALGAGIHTAITKHHSLHAYGIYNHISNGGIKDPNKGINWPTAYIAYSYSFNDNSLPVREYRARIGFDKTLHVYTDLFASSKTVSHGDKNRWFISGLSIGAAKQITNINRLSSGFELWYDYSLQQKILKKELNDEAWRSGVSLSHEFVLNRFLLSQGIGIYLLRPRYFFDALYQRYGLMFKVSHAWSVGIQVMAHRQVADFLDFRLRYYIR